MQFPDSNAQHEDLDRARTPLEILSELCRRAADSCTPGRDCSGAPLRQSSLGLAVAPGGATTSRLQARVCRCAESWVKEVNHKERKSAPIKPQPICHPEQSEGPVL